LQGLVFTGAARHGSDEVLDQLIALYEKADLPETKARLLRATGAFRREAPLRRAVTYTLRSGKVRPQDGLYVFAGAPIDTRLVVWALVKENWKMIDERYGKSSMIGDIISAAAGGIPTEAHAKDVAKFFKTHPAPFATESIKQTLEGIRARSKFRMRNTKALTEYFNQKS
jgi:aminopeptidase 2